VGSMDGRFAFLREVLGVTHPDLDTDAPRGENWGYLVRDMAPFPPSVDERLLIPGFALYGGDFLQPTRPSSPHGDGSRGAGGEDAGRRWPPSASSSWRPSFSPSFVTGWTASSLRPHLGAPWPERPPGGGRRRGRIQRIVHRDLSLGIDMRRRRDLCLSSDGLNAYNRMEDGTFASIAYDRMMGGHFFDHLLAPVLAAFPSLSPEDFRGPCREEFTRLFPDHQRYLPGRSTTSARSGTSTGNPSTRTRDKPRSGGRRQMCARPARGSRPNGSGPMCARPARGSRPSGSRPMCARPAPGILIPSSRPFTSDDGSRPPQRRP
jgi:hypothetical protein